MDSSTENVQHQQHQYQYPPALPPPPPPPPAEVTVVASTTIASHDPSQAQTYDPSSTQTHVDYSYDYNNAQQQQQQYQYQYFYPSNYPPQPPQPTYNPYYPLDPQLVPPPAASNPAPISHYSAAFDPSQTPIHPQIGQPMLRGGRRGYRPFRGGGRGHSAYHGPRPNNTMPASHSRGRGGGGGRHPSMPPSTAPGHAPGQVPAAPLWPPPQMAWCELCRVDCNTLEILEQHKNGKKHKKNLQIHEELQNLNKIITGQQNLQLPNSELKPDVQSEKVVQSKENETPVEDLPSQVGNDDKRSETDATTSDKRSGTSATTIDNSNQTELQKDNAENPKVPIANSAEFPQRKSRDRQAQGRGLKRKMRGGRGGKYARTNDGPRRPAEPPKSKEVIPFICELCNVKCESQVVFDSHMAGKKHLSKLKRFQGHQALYGHVGLQALYPSNFNGASSSAMPQSQQGANDCPDVLTQSQTLGLDTQTQGVAGAPTAAAAVPASELSLETRNDCLNQGSETLAEAGGKIDGTSGNTDADEENEVLAHEPKMDGNLHMGKENSSIAQRQDDTGCRSFAQ